MKSNRLLIGAWAVVLCTTAATRAMAIPDLQLFIEQADYEIAGENTSNPLDEQTWAKLGTTSFRLWVIGKTSDTYRYRDVKFVASFNDNLTPGLAFTPTTTGGAGGFGDLSTPDSDLLTSGIQGPTGPVSVPIADLVPPPGDSPLTNHSPLGGPNRLAVEWNLGMLYLTDSPIADFAPGTDFEASDNWFPVPTSTMGQINVYEVLVSGLLPGDQVHFDLYGIAQRYVTTEVVIPGACTLFHVPHANNPSGHPGGPHLAGGGASSTACLTFAPDTVTVTSEWLDVTPNKYVNAPFSHDARWEQAGGVDIGVDIPTPGTAALLLGGLGGMGWLRFTRQRKQAV